MSPQIYCVDAPASDVTLFRVRAFKEVNQVK